MLCDGQIKQFEQDGFVRIDEAFPREVAAQARDYLWRDLGCDEADPATWPRTVARLGMYTQTPFVEAANTLKLHAAFDQLCGAGGWQRCMSMGTFPIRFPSDDDAGDTGWHVDAGFGWDAPDFMEWRLNVHSKGRALLMLFLFSDIDHDDAPTRLRAGSHSDIARLLAAADEHGLSLRALAARNFASELDRREDYAVGPAGTVYLCHPFLVHAAQRHRGKAPRFLAQPPLLPTRPLSISDPVTPVERAIAHALHA